jgi:formylglycine-generating enzyme
VTAKAEKKIAADLSANGKTTRIDKYEILEQIGCGGMGAVYKALHPHFKKYVAIKEIRSDLASNPDIRQRFEQEAELLAQLPTHPNIVTVRDAFTSEGKLYLVMDYIDGETLRDLLLRGEIEPGQAANILDQILSGLEAIHRRGIVHRDLKASNILIDREGTAFISDFGIAGFIDKNSQDGAMATAKCAAPELIDPSLRRDGSEQQADIYAAGILAYEMLLGESRFCREFQDIYSGPQEGVAERWLNWHTDLSRVAGNLNDLDPDIPIPLANLVERMMAKDMSDRYKDASEARRDLAAGISDAQGSRGKIGPAADDATRPLDKMRAAAPKTAGPAHLPLTRPATPQRFSPQVAQSREPTVEPATSHALTQGTQRRIPLWILWIGGGAALFFTAFLLLLLLSKNPGFTLLVRGAPSGSDIFIDNVCHGISTTDGAVLVNGLKAGKRLVRVSHDGYVDFNTSISGTDGEEKSVIVQLTQAEIKPSVLNEIDYTGPMILIPAGEFIMGSDSFLPDEKPAHKITLPDYYIDKFEVTIAQYKRFCEATSRPFPSNPWWDEQYNANNPNAPVVGVSWNDASAYARWAGKRLPSEQEWEKAASWDPNGKKKRLWPWGEVPEPNRANLSSTHPSQMGLFLAGASAYGVQDLAGNAAEWIDTFYQPYPGNQTADPEYGTKNKVVRGGSFRSTTDEARTTRRLYHSPEFARDEKKNRSWLIGFRCVVSADDPALLEYLRKK